MISSARRAAFRILLDVTRGGFASDLLRTQTTDLASSDAGLANELVFGVLRYQAQLDFLIRYFSGRDAVSLDLEVRIALRLGIYQLRYLDRVPAHAAVDESVELVKQSRFRFAAGLANAVLRKVDRQLIKWPSPEVEFSQPSWLLENWRRLFGEDGARSIAKAFLRQPEAFVRIPPARKSDARDLEIEPTDVPGCYRLLAGDPAGFRRQDISSQAVVPLLGLKQGDTFLDLCAAPGNKTAQALETPVWAVACDRSFDRLNETIDASLRRVCLDAARPLPFSRPFERVLLDVPCSGTGTLGRNPEIKWRIQPEDLEVHHARQVRLLESALSVLAVEGRLVYSSCSLEYEENEQVVEEVIDRMPPDVVLEHQERRIPGIDRGDGFYAASIIRTR